MVRIGINGIGRIGRCVIRAFFESVNTWGEIVAVNGSRDACIHSHLLRYDSVHGVFACDVHQEGTDYLSIGGKKIRLFTELEPSNIPWNEAGVDIVLECTGKFNKRDLAYRHIGGTVKKVVVSAPVEGGDATIVFGVNNGSLSANHEVVSLGSCTTNCVAHLIKILDEELGIESGFITTIHSYTSDQSLVDSNHKDLRRARACTLSMIPTTTGVSKSIESLFPKLSGKISASSVRVPTPNVSIAELVFSATFPTNAAKINHILLEKSSACDFLHATSEQLVSVDFNHTTYSAIFDLSETIVTNNSLCRTLAWYDNEWAFAHRMLDVTQLLSQYL